MNGRLVDFAKDGDGNLLITLTNAGREELSAIIEFRDQQGIDSAFLELIEYQLSNGWELIRPEEVGALTSSVILMDDADRDDTGALVRCGRVYWHPNYAVEDPIESLRTTGRFLMTGAE